MVLKVLWLFVVLLVFETCQAGCFGEAAENLEPVVEEFLSEPCGRKPELVEVKPGEPVKIAKLPGGWTSEGVWLNYKTFGVRYKSSYYLECYKLQWSGEHRASVYCDSKTLVYAVAMFKVSSCDEDRLAHSLTVGSRRNDLHTLMVRQVRGSCKMYRFNTLDNFEELKCPSDCQTGPLLIKKKNWTNGWRRIPIEEFETLMSTKYQKLDNSKIQS